MKNRERLFSENGLSLEKVTLTDENGEVIDTFFEIIGPAGTVIASFNSLEEATLKFNTLVNDARPKPKVKTSSFSGPGM
ncbi:hypothetical protein ACK34T_04245 [Aeromonas veronii]